MKNEYVKPLAKPYDMQSINLMAGSMYINSGSKKIGLSSFFTDEDDQSTDSQGNSKYNFWD